MSFSWTRYSEIPLIAIFRGFETEAACKLASAVVEGGFRTLEVTLNSPDALETIAALHSSLHECNIGVGTVCSSEQVYESKRAGASFVVTPAVALDVLAACKEVGLPVFCGALTPSEALTATKAGADAVKLFPAQQFGAKYLAALRGPLDSIRFVPTGGITPENMKDYLAAGAEGFGIGGSLFPAEAIAQQEYASVTRKAQQFVKAYREAIEDQKA